MNGAVETSLALLAVASTESIRRLATQSVVLRRAAFGGWNVAVWNRMPRAVWAVTSWCVPLSVPVVVSLDVGAAMPALGAKRVTARMHARARRVRVHLAALRIGGLLALATLVVAVPFATYTYGRTGFVGAMLLLALLALIQSGLAFVALRRCGMPAKAARRAALGLFTPFSAHRGAEVVQAQVVADVPGILVVGGLAGPSAFLRRFRPLIYDATRSSSAPPVLEFVLGGAPESALRARPDECGDGNRFCPRCASVFRDNVAQCSDCADVTLVDATRAAASP